MTGCSGSHKDSNPSASACLARSSRGSVSSVANTIRPTFAGTASSLKNKRPHSFLGGRARFAFPRSAVSTSHCARQRMADRFVHPRSTEIDPMQSTRRLSGKTRPSWGRTTTLACLFAAMLAGVAAAGQFEDGQAAYDRGDYPAAFTLWRMAGGSGDVHSQFRLGMAYYTGGGTPRDYAQAAQWFRKAAEQGDADAQNHLGVLYAKGQGVTLDAH